MCLAINVYGQYKVPFMDGDESWTQQRTVMDRIGALQIPVVAIESITTEDLLDACLEFPYLIDLIFYEVNNGGFDKVMMEFNGFPELLKRDNIVEVALGRYAELPERMGRLQNEKRSEKAKLSLQYAMLEYIMSKEEVAKRMSRNNKMTLQEMIDRNEKVLLSNSCYLGVIHKFSISSLRNSLRDYEVYCVECEYTSTTDFLTPNGNIVPYTKVLTGGELTDDEYNELLSFYNPAAYPSMHTEEMPTGRYNCHGYAWSKANGGNDYWIDYTPIIFWTDESYQVTTLDSAEKVVYPNNHSAIKVSNIRFKSKWGPGPLVEHDPDDVPSDYGYSPGALVYYKRATPAVYGDTRPCSSTYRVYSLHDSASVSWSFLGGTSSSLIVQNSPSANKCTISNSSHTYIKDNLVATVTRSGAATYTVSKAIDTGVNFSGSYTGTYTGLAHSGVSFPAISSTSITSGNTYPVTAGYTLTLTSPYFQNATVSYTGSAVNSWTNSGNGTITMKLNNSWTTSTVTITGYKGCDVYQIKFFVFANMSALGSPQLVVESDGQTCEIMVAFESDGRLLLANELENSSELEWDLTIAQVKTGKIVYDKHLVGPGVKLDTTEWEPGVYAFRAKIGDKIVTQKMVIGKNKN